MGTYERRETKEGLQELCPMVCVGYLGLNRRRLWHLISTSGSH